MGEKCRAAYDAGVGLGLASYQAAAGSSLFAVKALNATRHARQLLVSYGYLSQAQADSVNVGQNNIFKTTFVPISEAIETEIRDHSPVAANAFHIGMSIAVAEGETSANWSPSLVGFSQTFQTAIDWLTEARLVATHFFPAVGFDMQMMQAAFNAGMLAQAQAHDVLVNLRLSYGKVVGDATSIP